MTLYDEIGTGYAVGRRTDPVIAAQLWDALGDAVTVLNVGAGTGSYEPPDRLVVAVEPSQVMRAQRVRTAAPCVAAVAEALPFRADCFDAAMAILSDHHWTDPIAGLREMGRVARRVVLLQWDPALIPSFWLVRDYLPEFAALAGQGLSLQARAHAIGGSVLPVRVPWNCTDGFFHAYWRRPHAYLDESVRRATSVWARLVPAVEHRAVTELAADLRSGRWHERNADLVAMPDADLGARLVISRP